MQRPDLNALFSFSRIQTFDSCATFYRHKYIDRVTLIGMEPWFMLGKAYHAGMEYLFNHHTPTLTPHDITRLVLTGIREWWQTWFAENSETTADPKAPRLVDLFDGYMTYAEQAREALDLEDQLTFRASAQCQDPATWIRKPDGSLYTAPKMSNAWKAAAKGLKLEQVQAKVAGLGAELLATARQWCPALAVSTMTDLPAVVAESLQLGRKYEHLPGIKAVLGVELGFGQDPGTAFVLDGFEIQGFIDLILELDVHGITVIDHKTSKVEYTELEVMHHEQLLLYALALKTLMGIPVDSIGIHNVRFGSKVIMPVDWALAEQTVARLRATLKRLATEQDFTPQHPFNKYAAKPCLGKSVAPYNHPDHFKMVCPYFELCHPALHQTFQTRLLEASVSAPAVAPPPGGALTRPDTPPVFTPRPPLEADSPLTSHLNPEQKQLLALLRGE